MEGQLAGTNPVADGPGSSAAFAPDGRYGPYRLLERIGSGAASLVFRAVDDETGQNVAIKTLELREPGDLACLRREIHALGRLRNDGIVRVLGQGVADGIPWYAMELLEGETIDVLWKTGPRGPDAAREWSALTRRSLRAIRQLCDTLAFLHGEGIVHRDLKPANVVLRANGAPVLVDFGFVARFGARSGRETLDVGGGMFGTLAYMAPEQARGEFVDARADLYSIGCMLYEAATGSPPFTGAAWEIHDQQLRAAPIPPASRAVGVPRALDDLILRLLSKEPADRLGYAVDVSAGLREILRAGAQAEIQQGGQAEIEHNAPTEARRNAQFDAPGEQHGEVRDEACTWMRSEGRGETTDPSCAETGRRTQDEAAGRARGESTDDADDDTGSEANAFSMYLYRPRFSGRQEHLRRIEADVASLDKGIGNLVLVGGESGVGKTRFAMEATRTATQWGAAVVVGQCVSLESSTDLSQAQGGPLHPLMPLLGFLSDYCRSRGPEAAERLLGRRANTLAAYEASLAALPGTQCHGDLPPMPAAAARERLVSDLAVTLRLLAAEVRLVVVLDDLQWADELTLHVLTSLSAEFFRDAAFLVIGCYRSEECGPALTSVLDAHAASSMKLGRLDDRNLARIASDMLAIRNPPETLTRFLGEQAEGNPFFVSEYLRMVVDEQRLVRAADGQWQVSGHDGRSAAGYDRLPTPPSVQALVQRRLDSLSVGGRRMLVAAAVLGRECNSGLLQQTGEFEDSMHFEAVTELLTRHVLEEAVGGQFRFTHDKLREVAYDGLGATDRRDLHRRAAIAIESCHDGELASWYPSLGLHWSNGGDNGRAAGYYSRAGQAALRAGASGDARALLQRALSCDERNPVKAPGLERSRWLRQLGEADYGMGDIEAAIVNSSRALASLGYRSAGGRADGLWRIVSGLSGLLHRPAAMHRVTDAGAHEAALAAGQASQAYYLASRFVDGLASGLHCTTLARRSGGLATATQAFAQVGYLCGTVGLLRLKSRCFEQARALRDHADPNVFGGSLYFEAMSETGLGRWGPATAVGQEAVRLLQQVGNRQEAETALAVVANALYYRGQFEEAAACCGALLDSAKGRGNAHHVAWGLFLTGRSRMALGHLTEAVAFLDEGRAMLLPGRDALSLLMCEGSLARALLYQGDVVRASEIRTALEERSRSVRVVALAQCIDGLAALAEVSLALWQRDGSGALRASSQRACASLDRFARMFPFARPVALRNGGELTWLDGSSSRALRLWRKSLASATALDMPYEAACAHHVLGSRSPAAAEQRRHRNAAVLLFEQLGCGHHLAEMGGTNPREGGVG